MPEDPKIIHTARIDSPDGKKTYFVDFKTNSANASYVVVAERVNRTKKHNVIIVPKDLIEGLAEILLRGNTALENS